MSDPRVWGTDLWATMHRFSLAYPLARPSNAQRQAAYRFFESIASLMPCIGCRMHYSDHFRKTFSQQTTDSRWSLARWVYDFHELVNERLKKPTGVVKFEDLPKIYNVYQSRYISLDGQKLLEEPRYSTLADDFSGAEQNIQRSKGVQAATKVYDALARAESAAAQALQEQVESTANRWKWIGIAFVILISLVAVLIAVVIAKTARERKKTQSASKQTMQDNFVSLKGI